MTLDTEQLDAATVISWFRSTSNRKVEPLPDEQQVSPLLDFLLSARSGKTARLKPYRNPASRKNFTNAMDALAIAASTALSDTIFNVERAKEELPDHSAIKDVLLSKFQNDEAALRDLISTLASNVSRFPRRQHQTRIAEWHEPVFALYIAVGKTLQAIGRKCSVNKPTSPAIRIIVRALASIEGEERTHEAVVEALRAKLHKGNGTTKKRMGIITL